MRSLTMYIQLYILNLEALGMMENDLVELNRIDNNIVITKVKKKKELTLEDIFKD